MTLSPPRSPSLVPPARLVLLALLVLGLLVPLAPTATGLAQQQERRTATNLDESVTAALTEAGHATPGRVHVVPAEERGDWSFGTAALLGTEEDGGPPDIVFYLAKRDGKRWRAEVETTAAYQQLLRQAPDGLVPAVFRAPGGGVRAQADPKPPAMAMPIGFPADIRLQQTPYSLGGQAATAFDLEVANRPPCEGAVCPADPPILAAAGGYATLPCAVGSSLGSIVVIQHETGWRTTYFYVIPTGNFPTEVRRQFQIGILGRDARKSCAGGGEVFPERAGLALSRATPQGPQDVELRGQTFGGWTFVGVPEREQICLQKQEQVTPFTRELTTVCQGDTFWNDGSFGAGVSFTQKPQRPKRGEKVGLTLAGLPANQNLEAVYIWTDTATASVKERVVKDFRSTASVKKLFISFKQPGVVPGRAKLCIRYIALEESRNLLTCQ